MQSLCVLSKRTKQGLSVFHFVQTPDNQFWAFGGVAPKAMHFKSRKELDQCVKTWIGYGFTVGMAPPVKAQAKAKASRPSKPAHDLSQLPLDLQADLWALPVSA